LKKRQNRQDECFYEIAPEYAELADTETCDSFMLSMLQVAMFYGEDLHISGLVSEQLLLNLNREIIPILNAFNAQYRKINLTADRTYSRAIYNGHGVGTGFSGGVDSFFTFLNNFAHPVSEERKITHAFFFNVGSHGVSADPKELAQIHGQFESRYNYLTDYPREIGLPFIKMNSNIHRFQPSGHIENCSFVTCGAGLLFQKGLRRYLLSSGGYNYKEKFDSLLLGENKDTSTLDPLLLPYFSTENLQFSAVETKFSRMEKLNALSVYEPALHRLNICYRHDELAENCSVCEKCGFTLLMLNVLGCIDQFASAFDLKKYYRMEKYYAAKALVHASTDIYYADICRQAKERGFSLRSRTTLMNILAVKIESSRLHEALRKSAWIRKLGRWLKR
jgi:hypothetical protein